jgi:hypothetical protein
MERRPATAMAINMNAGRRGGRMLSNLDRRAKPGDSSGRDGRRERRGG